MTNEQRIRGADARVDWAVVVTGYQEEAVTRTAAEGLGAGDFASRGATGVVDAAYRVAHSVTHDELRA